MLAEIPVEELTLALDAVALELVNEAGVAGPPVDALAVARALGIEVAWDDRQTGRARCVRLGRPRGRGPRAAILVRPDVRPEREHWALAHEIGEHAAARAFGELGVDFREVTPKAREWMANQLAGRLLLPRAWFLRDAVRLDWDLVRLKARYATASHELIARRMLELPPPILITIFDQGAVSFRRGNVLAHAPPPSAAELRCWRAVHRRNVPFRTHDGCLEVRGWPIHEPGRQREILRREVDLEGAED